MDESSKISLLKEVFGHNVKYFQNSNELLVPCPYCLHHKPKLSINLTINCYKCWVCGKKGKNLFFLLREFASKSQFYKSKKLFFFQETEHCDDLRKEIKLSLPDEYIFLLNNKETIYCKDAFVYLESRGLSEEDILKYKIGFCKFGLYKNRIIVPSFDKNGNLNYFTGRTIDPNSTLSYLDPQNLPREYKKSVIINELYLDFNQPIVLVEGFFDSFKATNSVPILGSSFGKEHALFQKFVAYNTDIYLALDPDAFNKTLVIAKKLLAYDLNVRYIDIEPYKDPGEMTKELFLERQKDSVVVNDNFILRQKVKRIK